MDNDAEASTVIAKVLSALADPVRRQVLDLIALKTDATATTIAVALPISRQAVTKRLTVLEDAGLVTTARHGCEVRYSLQTEPIGAACRWLLQLAESWDVRLARLKHIAES